MEGQSVNLTASGSSDTATDSTSLVYSWDSSTIPGGPDSTGEVFELRNLPIGTVWINLTVIDDDGQTDTATLQFTVKAKYGSDCKLREYLEALHMFMQS